MFLVAGASFGRAIQPYFYKIFIDAIPAGSFEFLLRILFYYVGVRFVSLFLGVIGRTVGDIVMIDIFPQANTEVFSRLQDLDFAFHVNKSSGKIINRMKRGENVFWDLHNVLNFQVLDFLVSFSVMLYFFKNINITIVLLAFVAMILSFIAAAIFIPKNVSTRQKFNKFSDRVTAVIVDNFINFETVKMFANEVRERARLTRTYVPWKKWLWRYSLSFRYIGLSVTSILNISLFLILFILLRPTSNIQIDPGEFILVIGFLNHFQSVTFDLIWNLRNVAKNVEDIRKYFEFLEEPIKIKDPEKPVHLESVAGEIEFDRVSFKYEKDEKDAVRNISLNIRQGQSVAFVGSSGAGKTTMVKLLMRFFDVDKGKITIDGVNIKDFTKSNLRSFMGVVPQEPVLFNNTIGYNIAYGKDKASKKEIVAASKLANIHDFIEGLPKKYQTQVGERGIKLSGGQKQRVAIARMILSDPEIIIFDEATSQLDSQSEKLIQTAFWKAREAKTTIIIAHRLSTILRADKIVVMEDGHIVESGSHLELLKIKNGRYRHFWDLQTDID